MSSTRRDQITLLDIASACRSIASFLAGRARTHLIEDEQLRSAVLFQMLVIGEAVKRLSDSFRAAHDDVPWRSIAGMRDRLIHGYDDIDAYEVWRVATTDIPNLLSWLEPLLPKPPQG